MAASLVVTGLFGAQAQAGCRVEKEIRIDRASDVSRWSDVCEVEKLAIFVDGEKSIIFPNLQSAGLINIDTVGTQSVAMPALKHVRDLYLSGSGMEVAEFPVLETVEGRLVVNRQNIKFLNFPELLLAGRVILSNCPDLEFVFVDKLKAINSLRNEGTPSLNEESAAFMASVSLMTNEEWMQRNQEAERMRQFKNKLMSNPFGMQPIRPTGHKTQFKKYDVDAYYNWYPYEYHRYWYAIGTFGFQWFYIPR
jgi:hypothetical protein